MSMTKAELEQMVATLAGQLSELTAVTEGKAETAKDDPTKGLEKVDCGLSKGKDGALTITIPSEPIGETANGYKQFAASGANCIVKHGGGWCWLNLSVTSLGEKGLKRASKVAVIK